MTKISGIPVTDSQAAVYGALKQFPKGLPDHALVPFAQHALSTHQSSSGIRTRRSELVDLGLVEAVGTTKTGSNRTAAVYAIAGTKRSR